MRYFPIFVDTAQRSVIVCGAGEVATAKLRLLLKSEANIRVFGGGSGLSAPTAEVSEWAAEGRLAYCAGVPGADDFATARLVYIAFDPDNSPAAPQAESTSADQLSEKRRLIGLAHASGALVNVVDTPDACDFITPAIVDRDPVVVAIGTEGTAPVLARQLKAKVEALLPVATGSLARLAGRLRGRAGSVPAGAPRRRLWAHFFEETGPRVYAEGGERAAEAAFDALVADVCSGAISKPENRIGHILLVGAGPGDPDLLTVKAQRVLGDADVVIHDRLVSDAVLELARREARLIAVGKQPGGKGWSQDAINRLMIDEARTGQQVVRLKSGDPGIYGRLDEEVAALDQAGVSFEVVPGISAAIAGAAELGLSLTRRGRNSSFRLLTGHDIEGFAEHDWLALARPGASAAIYMGLRAARFIEGRLLMHGADPATPVTVVENISRAERRELSATLAGLSEAMTSAAISGPVILYLGIAARDCIAADGAAFAEPTPITQEQTRHAQIA